MGLVVRVRLHNAIHVMSPRRSVPLYDGAASGQSPVPDMNYRVSLGSVNKLRPSTAAEVGKKNNI